MTTTPTLDYHCTDQAGGNFAGAGLVVADFRATNLRGATFDGADLRGACFDGADLTGATFIGANLTRASLKNTNLRGTNLTGATVDHADVSGGHVDDDTIYPGFGRIGDLPGRRAVADKGGDALSVSRAGNTSNTRTGLGLTVRPAPARSESDHPRNTEQRG